MTANGWRGLGLILLLLIPPGCGVGSGADRFLFPGTGRHPNWREWGYVYIARYTKSAKPCFKVSKRAYWISAFSGPGTEIELIRSDCFRLVAQLSGDSELCENAPSVSSLWWDGSGLSREKCRQDAQNERTARFSLSTPPHPARLIKELGYTRESMFAECEDLIRQNQFWSQVRARNRACRGCERAALAGSAARIAFESPSGYVTWCQGFYEPHERSGGIVPRATPKVDPMEVLDVECRRGTVLERLDRLPSYSW